MMLRIFNQIKLLYYRVFCDKISVYRKHGMKIGNGCSINTWNFLEECYLIEIGDNVQITAGVRIFTHGGGYVLRKLCPNFDCFGKVCIGNNVYIGNNAMIMPGITIGDNVVIGAGSIVTKNVPDNVVIAGNPAKIVCSIDNYRDKYLQYNLDCKHMNVQEKKKYLLSLPDERFLKVKGTLK